MANSQSLQIDVELELRRRAGELRTHTIVGLVCPDKGHTHTLTNITGSWQPTDNPPDVYLPIKLERVLITTKRFVAVIGGRGSGKSVGIADICTIDAKDNSSKTYCLREFQSSIKNSVHSLLKSEIERLEFTGFEAQQQSILKDGEDVFQFAGIARNVDSIKSAHGFKRFYVEEAQFVSQDSLEVLTPTVRNKPNKGLPTPIKEKAEDSLSGVQIVFVANPGSSEDPFSKRFINPFKDSLDRDGYYEDEMHLIVMMNYDDNPWYAESGLEQDRLWTYKNMPRTFYDHVWNGGFNDSVENSIIIAEWFDACVDAHKKLGFQPTGAKIAAHDPSDMGDDTKGYAMRHGSVFLEVTEKTDGDVNEGCHWACGLANQHNVDYFTWDADGMGCALNEQISQSFNGRDKRLVAFKGSESPDNPDAIYKPAMKAVISDQKKVKDAVKNKRAQYYTELRDRVYRTYRAVVHKEYFDPDTMISFDSSIELLSKLRAELCRMPIKPNRNGLVELYTKEEMKSKFKFKSPNLADSVMMSCRFIQINRPYVHIPKPLPTYHSGRR